MEYLIHGLQILIVVFAFSFIIFFHELGHLLAGIWRGLHVERFSVGFGAPIWKTTYKGIEYCIGWIPLGGYVALPQLDAADSPQTFDGKPLPLVSAMDRIIVAFAGPIFNIVLGFVLSLLVWQFGVPSLPRESRIEVGHVDSIMLYDGKPRWTPEWAAGLRPGDVVTAVNGEPFDRGWEELQESIIFGETKRVVLTVERDGVEQAIEYDMLGSSRAEGLWLPNFEPGYEVVVAGIAADEKYPAAKELHIGDTILEVNGEPVRSPSVAVELINQSGAHPVTMKVRRVDGGQTEEVTLTPVLDKWVEKPRKFMAGFGWSSTWPMPWVVAVPEGTQAAAAGLQPGDIILDADGEPVLTLEELGARAAAVAAEGRPLVLNVRRGVENLTLSVQTGSTPGTEDVFANLTGAQVEVAGVGVVKVNPGSPAEAAGLQVGDRVMALGGEPITTLPDFSDRLQVNRNKEIALTVRRNGEDIDLPLQPRHVEEMETELYRIGLSPSWKKVLVKPSPLSQFGRTARQIQTMLRRIVSRNNPIQVKHMSTFPGIAMIMKQSVNSGVMTFINLLVFINFMLAIVNLFPFPILDGGHIVFGFAEIVARRRLPTKPVRILQVACFGLLVSFILYVLWFDTIRVGNSVVNWFDRAQPAEVTEPPPDEPAPVPAEPPATPDAPKADTTPPANT